MYASFVAHGPFSTNIKDIHTKRAMKGPAPGFHSISSDVTILDGFENVEIYGLVTKLLGIEHLAASNNGTKGFWDKYF